MRRIVNTLAPIFLLIAVVTALAMTPVTMKSIVTCVIWEDSTGFAETWLTTEEVLELDPGFVTSCGFVVAKTEKRIWLALDHYEEDGESYWSGITSIPSGWIISTEEKK